MWNFIGKNASIILKMSCAVDRISFFKRTIPLCSCITSLQLEDVSFIQSGNDSCRVMGNDCHYTAASLSGYVCSTLLILRLFSTSISPTERNLIYYNLHVLITVIWATSGAGIERDSSHPEPRIKLHLRPVVPSDIETPFYHGDWPPNENETNDPSSARLETAQQVHLINFFSCISLPTMTKHYVNAEYMLWKNNCCLSSCMWIKGRQF